MIKLKILVVTQYFWPEEFRVNDICKGLIEKGHKVDVLTGLPNYPSGNFPEGYSFFKRGVRVYEGIKLHRSYVIPRGQNSKLKLALNYISFVFFSLFHIPKMLLKKFDRIFVFQTSPITSAVTAVIIGRIKRIPSAIYIQDLWPETFYSIVPMSNGKVRKVLKKVCIKIYNSFDLILIASKGYENILIEDGINSEKIKYFPQWAEDLYLNNNDGSNIIEKHDNEFIVTFAGNIGKVQSVDTIIKAANLSKDRKNIKWMIIGDGSEFKNVEQLVKDYGLEETVRLLGKKPTSEMPKYYSISDALIVTLKNDEILRITLPAKVQSYMASGKPILGAISGEGMNTIKESKAGLVCEAEDYEGLYKNVIKLYEMSKEKRNEIGENGRKYFIDNYSRSKLLDKLENYLLKLTNNKKRGAD